MSDISNNYQLSCPRDQFSKLLKMIEIFQNSCTDCDIKKGLMRCRTDDRTAIIEMNLSSILQENDLTLNLIKTQIATLKGFELDDNVQMNDKSILITSDDSNYRFRDEFTESSFRKPSRKYLGNTFIEQEDFDSIIRIREENLILSYVITSYMKKRISTIAIGLNNIDHVTCFMSGLECDWRITSKNKTDMSKVAKGIVLNKEVNDKKFDFLIYPFNLDIMSDIKMSCYNLSNDNLICKYEMNFFGIPINIYHNARFLALTD